MCKWKIRKYINTSLHYILYNGSELHTVDHIVASCLPEAEGTVHTNTRVLQMASSILYLNTWIFHEAWSTQVEEGLLVWWITPTQISTHAPDHSPHLCGLRNGPLCPLPFHPRGHSSITAFRRITREMFHACPQSCWKSCISSNKQMKEHVLHIIISVYVF